MRDDERTYLAEIDRCMGELGKHLHEPPHAGIHYPSVESAAAQYYMLRIQYLERLGVGKGAEYIREEVLAALRRDAADMETALPLLSKNLAVGKALRWNQPSATAMAAQPFTYSDVIDAYSEIMRYSP